MKRIIKIITVVLIITMLSIQVIAASKVEHTSKADALKAVGLFNGTAKGYELERAPSRLEAAVMLIRLLGKESAAKELNSPHPFTDVPGWANPYIGYMYANGLSTGIGNNLFGSDKAADAKSFATFVLRALGYNDKDGDFTWGTALDFAVTQQVMTAAELKNLAGQVFLRDEMVFLSYQGLKAKLKDSQDQLVDKLIAENSVAVDKAVIAGIADRTKYKDALLPKVFAEGTIADINSTQDKIGHFSGELYFYSSSTSDYYLSAPKTGGLTENSIATVVLFNKGVKVKTLYSVCIDASAVSEGKSLTYHFQTKQEPFDSISYKITGTNEFLLTDSFYPVKVTRIKATEYVKALPLFKAAGYIGTNETYLINESWSDSTFSLAGIVRNLSFYPNGNLYHHKSYTMDGKLIVENLFKNSDYQVTSSRPITMSKTTYSSQVSTHSKVKNEIIGFEIMVNTQKTSFFVLRDANYKVTDIVIFTK